MTRHPLIKTFMVLMAVLFLAMQSFTQAHATSYGDLDHDHDGVPCDVFSIAAEQVIPTPPAPKTEPQIIPVLTKTPAPIIKPRPRSFKSRAPPLRGPPL